MDSKNQLAVFALCVGIGFIGGMIYEAFACIGLPFCRKGKRRWLRVALDISFWLTFAVFCIFCSYIFKFPSFRAYIWLGYLTGGIIYAKSMRRILAFFKKICYNKLAKIRKRRKNKEKNLLQVEK